MGSRNPNTLLAVPSEDTFDFLFKVVLIGDCGTGKTCVVQRFKTGNYIESHGNTIGVDFSMKTISIDGKKVKVSHPTLWLLSSMGINSLLPDRTFFLSHTISDSNMGYGRAGTLSNDYTELLSIGQRCYHWWGDNNETLIKIIAILSILIHHIYQFVDLQCTTSRNAPHF